MRTDRRARRGPIAQRAAYRADAGAELANWLGAAAPFRERLVCSGPTTSPSASASGGVAALAGAFVREAIRPHVTGRFADMLLAVMRHPAMLIYLDNAASIGPDSGAGQRLHRGLNENLARECLELHTIGPAAGYTQADVTSFARILTGWSIDRQADPPGFLFRPIAHEPGGKTVMGRRFPPGEEGGIAALRVPRRPSGDAAPPRRASWCGISSPTTRRPRRSRRSRRCCDDTGGDLGAAAAALVASAAGLGAARQAAQRRTSTWSPRCGRSTLPPARAAATCRPWPASASRCSARRCRMAGRTSRPTGPAPEAMLRRVDWAYARRRPRRERRSGGDRGGQPRPAAAARRPRQRCTTPARGARR